MFRGSGGTLMRRLGRNRKSWARRLSFDEAQVSATVLPRGVDVLTRQGHSDRTCDARESFLFGNTVVLSVKSVSPAAFIRCVNDIVLAVRPCR